MENSIKDFKFYEVSDEYREYLWEQERKVPKNDYEKNNKFFCGIVLEINGYKYYAPISSFTIKQRTNILIYDTENPRKCLSSIRFSFMIPVPEEHLEYKDFSKEDIQYMNLLMKEYNYCKGIKDTIYKTAERVYNWGINKDNPISSSCCDFKLLEKLHDEYIEKNKTIVEEAALGEA